ncbi:cold-regulated 413 inner membrane protein 2, chloroplastic-like [Amaranthus tricolor]|uniref:cold-regulated 413 inner membrane protein 2, chloroplastic-like n=1 Tax=Amaranthus tricolor TaxID=29722 RepID=UPI00258A0842|nr:cold-regulated 413 inner membrane protein 2, chloroplastic-like [Amaranthus tricolor]
MQWHCLSLSSSTHLPSSSIAIPSPISLSSSSPHLRYSPFSSHHSINFNPLRLSLNHQIFLHTYRRNRSSMAVYNSYSAVLSPRILPWISAVSTAILMLVKGTAINRSFLVPFFALQAPATVISWMQGEYGAWSAFVALLVRLFFFIPGELELPFLTLVLVIVAPHRALNLRGTQAGAIISLVIAVYLAFQHFTRAGSLRKSFDQNSILATIGIICITIVPCLLLI